jgi:uncharacterized protein DUF1360
MTAGVFALAVLACYRATRLVTTDTITAPMRHGVLRRFPPRTLPLEDPAGQPIEGTAGLRPTWQVELVNCTWCIGLWVALALVLALHFTGYANSWLIVGFAWFAVAAVAGLLARLEA